MLRSYFCKCDFTKRSMIDIMGSEIKTEEEKDYEDTIYFRGMEDTF